SAPAAPPYPSLYPRISRSILRQPISSQKEPERQPGVTPVPFEAALDRPIAHRPLSAEQPRVRGPSPRVEDEPVVASEHQHDVRRGVGSNTRKRQQPGGHLIVRQVVARRGRERL